MSASDAWGYNMKLTILYEDNDIAGIYKPVGMLVHGDGKKQEYTVADWVKETFPGSAQVGEPLLTDDETLERPGIVHRLDKDTSGVLLVAKTDLGFQTLKEQFKERSIKKVYYAFIYGKPRDTRGLINKPIGRSGTDFRQYSTNRASRGEMREAITRYVVKEHGHSASFVHVFPETGRTHQIRVHFKAIRHPLLADPVYGIPTAPTLGFTRTALHAFAIEFTNTKGNIVRVEAPIPEDFKQALELLRK